MTKEDFLADTKQFIHTTPFLIVAQVPALAAPMIESLRTSQERVLTLVLYALIQEDLLDEAEWQKVFDAFEKHRQEHATCE